MTKGQGNLTTQKASLLGEVRVIDDASIGNVIRSAIGFHNIAVVVYYL
jgi:hypothetical protein